LLQLGTRWRANWHENAIERAGIFSYRNLVGGIIGETID